MPFLLEEAFPPQGFCRHPQLITVLGVLWVRSVGTQPERYREPGQGEAQTSLMGDAEFPKGLEGTGFTEAPSHLQKYSMHLLCSSSGSKLRMQRGGKTRCLPLRSSN